VNAPADNACVVRVNVFLSRCGVASRRSADKLIASSRVTVNGLPAELGARIDTTQDVVCLDGRVITPVESKTTLVMNKPSGYLVSRRDPHYTRTVYDLLPSEYAHLVPVGRLDLDTEGVLLMTNDGGLVEHLTHPRYRIPRVYRALVKGHPDAQALDRLRNGVEIEGGTTSPAEVRVCEKRKDTSELELVLREGRKREVRLMCRAVGHEVLRLKRTEFAGIGLAGLATAAWRVLSAAECERLWKQVECVDGRGD